MPDKDIRVPAPTEVTPGVRLTVVMVLATAGGAEPSVQIHYDASTAGVSVPFSLAWQGKAVPAPVAAAVNSALKAALKEAVQVWGF